MKTLFASCPTEPTPAHPPRLLFVEKDASMQTTLMQALAASHAVETVPDGLAATFAARREPPGLVIIDLYLPGTDNLTFIRSLRADPSTAAIPIIVLSAPTSRELLLRCLGAGASNFLLKPFRLPELLACVGIESRLRASLQAPTANLPAPNHR